MSPARITGGMHVLGVRIFLVGLSVWGGGGGCVGVWGGGGGYVVGVVAGVCGVCGVCVWGCFHD